MCASRTCMRTTPAGLLQSRVLEPKGRSGVSCSMLKVRDLEKKHVGSYLKCFSTNVTLSNKALDLWPKSGLSL